MDKIRNEYIRGTAQVGRFGEKTREARLMWYGHVLRKDDDGDGKFDVATPDGKNPKEEEEDLRRFMCSNDTHTQIDSGVNVSDVWVYFIYQNSSVLSQAFHVFE